MNGDYFDDETGWQVPQYLRPMYQLWSQLGFAYEQLMVAASMASVHARGVNDEDGSALVTPSTIVEATLKAPVDAEDGDEDPLTLSEALGAAVAITRMATAQVHARLRSMDALPPWWDERVGLEEARPIMEAERKYYEFLAEELGEGDPDE